MSDARDTAAADTPLAAQSGKVPSSHPVLQMRGIVKRFGANVALNSVDFQANVGEIHALLGENGAGKSTLMHVLTGMLQPDAGTILLDGFPTAIDSPRTARAHSLAMVHQHFTLVPAFTVAENLALDSPPERSSGLFRAYSVTEAAQGALRHAKALGWTLDPNARVRSLPVGIQQRVEIARVLATEARVVIFDEPTAVLAPNEVEELFGVLRRLRAEGKAVVLIAHKLAEILAVADRVTVLRRGNRIASAPIGETDARRLAAWMMGEAFGFDAAESRRGNDDMGEIGREADTHQAPVFIASGITVVGQRGEQAVNGVDISVRRGEIFGIGGVDGNGQAELAEALVGLRPAAAGKLTWDGAPFHPGIAPTTGYIPPDRRGSGLALGLSVEENLVYQAAREPAYRSGPFVKRMRLRALASTLIRDFDIRTGGPASLAGSLSGGNQQKIVVARALRARPEWIVAVNPTRGLDIGATRFVHTQLLQARDRGAAIVLISTDWDEVALLSDRAAILSGGRLTDYKFDKTGAESLGLLFGGMGIEGADRGDSAAGETSSGRDAGSAL